MEDILLPNKATQYTTFLHNSAINDEIMKWGTENLNLNKTDVKDVLHLIFREMANTMKNALDSTDGSATYIPIIGLGKFKLKTPKQIASVQKRQLKRELQYKLYNK